MLNFATSPILCHEPGKKKKNSTLLRESCRETDKATLKTDVGGFQKRLQKRDGYDQRTRAQTVAGADFA